MEFASFKKFNGSLTIHFFTDNLMVYALDGDKKAIEKWENLSKQDKDYFVSREWEKQNKQPKNEKLGSILDTYEKYGW